MLSLSLLHNGDRAEVVDVAFSLTDNHTKKNPIDGRMLENRIESIGIRIGKTIEVLNKRKSGPMVIKIDDFRVVVGRDLARNIKVRRK